MAASPTPQLNQQINAARTAGYSDNEIKSFLTQKGFNAKDLAGTSFAYKPTGIKGFVINNLPAITGGLAAVASSPLELADAVTGVGGTAANAAIAGAGSAAGEALKEKLLGQNVNAKQVAVQGLEGGALDSAGAALKGGRTAAKAAFEGTDQTATKEGGNVVSKMLNNAAAKSQAADTEKQAAVDTAPYAGVDKATRQKLGMNNVINYAKSQGMGTDPASLRAIADSRTGANGAISGSFRQILGNVGQVDTSSVMPAVDKELGMQVGDLGSAAVKGGAADNTRNSVLNILSAHGLTTPSTELANGQTLEGALTKNVAAGASIAPKNDPNAVFDTIQDLDKRISGSPYTDAGQARGSVYGAAKGALEDSLYGASGVDKAVQDFKLSPEDEDAVRGIVAQHGGSDALAQNTIDDINGAKSGQEMRSLQAKDVQAGKLANAADKAASGELPKATAGRPSGILSGSPSGAYYATMEGIKAVHNPLMAAPLIAHNASNVIGRLAGRLAPAAAEGAEDMGAKVAGEEAPQAAGTLSQLARIPRNMALAPIAAPGQTALDVGKQVAGRDLGNAVGGGAQNSGAATPSAFSTQLANTQSQTANEADQSQTTNSPFNTANIENAIQADIALNGGKNVSMLVSLYNTFGSQKAQTNGLTTDQQNDVVANSKATSVLNAYMQQLGGGATGPVEGRVSSLLGNVLGGSSANAKALESQRTDVASTIAATLSPTGRPAASITNKIADSLPSITDSSKVAEAKYNDLIERIQAGEFSATTPVTTLEGGE